MRKIDVEFKEEIVKMATNKRTTKKLTTTNTQKAHKIFDEQLTVEVYSEVTNESYELKIDKKFSKTKKLQLNADLLAAAQYAQLNNVDFEFIFIQYALLLTIKYFTSFGEGMTSNISEQVAILDKLNDLDLLTSIIEAMPQDQLKELFESVAEIHEKYNEDLQNIFKDIDELEKTV
jgi:hypothetical protein